MSTKPGATNLSWKIQMTRYKLRLEKLTKLMVKTKTKQYKQKPTELSMKNRMNIKNQSEVSQIKFVMK